MDSKSRKYSFEIWGLALGYFGFYLPYCALIKTVTGGLWPGMTRSVSGFEMLPVTSLSTALAMTAIITVLGWWKYSSRRKILGLHVPFPGRWTFLSGIATAVIISTTTLAYSFEGISIVLALVLLRGGVLTIAPFVDTVFKRRVRWFSWVALGLSLMALMVALGDVGNYKLSLAAIINVAAYLIGYLLRLPCMTRLAKSEDRNAGRRYFVEEQAVAIVALAIAPAMLAFIGKGDIQMEMRHGFTIFFESGAVGAAVLAGLLYAGLCVFGTLIYLDRRENTFCIPLNRCASLLSGVAAACALSFLFDQARPSAFQFAGAGLIVLAILFLSPLHHGRLFMAKLKRSIEEARSLQPQSRAEFARRVREIMMVPLTESDQDQVAEATDLRQVDPESDLGAIR